MNSSYYITQIEKLMNKLKISLDDAEYNNIFNEENDKMFYHKLVVYYNKLLKMYDKKQGDHL